MEENYQPLFTGKLAAIEAAIQNKIKEFDGKKYVRFDRDMAFNDDWAQALSNIIKKDPDSFIVFSAMGTSMTDKGIKILAKLLQENKTITSANLEWNGMTDEGLKALADMLLQNNTLTTVYLGKPNKTTAEGVRYLAQKVVERERNYPSLKAHIDFSEVTQAHDTEDLDAIYQQTLKECRNSSKATIVISPN